MAQRRNLESPALIQKKRRSRRRKIRIFVALAVVVLGGLVALTRLPAIRIYTVNVQGGESVPTTDVQAYIESRLAGYYALVIPKNNSIIFSFTRRDKVANGTLATFSRLETADFTLPSMKKMMVVIKERKPANLFCVPTPAEAIPEQCYFVDNRGYIFDKAPYFSGSAYFKFYNPSITGDIVTGRVLDPVHFTDAETIIMSLKGTLLTPTSFVVTSDNEAKIILKKTSNTQTDAPYIYIRADVPASGTVDNIKAALASPEFADKLKTHQSSLLYLDVRYPDQVYFKWNDGTPKPTTTEPTAVSAKAL